MKKSLLVILTIVILGLFSITSLADNNNSEEKSNVERVTASVDNKDKSDKNKKVSTEPTVDLSSYKPSNEEIAALDIPVKVSNARVFSKQDPEITITKSEGITNASAWFLTETNPILVSESKYESGINVDEMLKEATSWHEHNDVEITEFKGNPMVVSDKGAGIYEIHIITSEKIFTLGGTEKDVLLSIAEEINFK